MKNNYALTTLVALLATLSFSQLSASGMTYDPVENYYSKFYGIGVVESATTTPAIVAKDMAADIGPYDGYYATYYGTGVESKQASAEIIDSALNDEMANPLNYYNW
jgi:hypothetical protein